MNMCTHGQQTMAANFGPYMPNFGSNLTYVQCSYT